jgi:hypothetical protein
MVPHITKRWDGGADTQRLLAANGITTVPQGQVAVERPTDG